METRVYNGNCHCGAYRFQVTVPEIKHLTACSCRLCVKKGYYWLVPPPGSVKVRRDDGHLTSYECATLKDKFCGICGTGVFGEHVDGPMKGQVAVNLRTIREVNPYELENVVTTVLVEDATKSHVDATTASASGVEQAGSCHCGNVRVELLYRIEDEEIKEDNCSVCVRNAWTGTYPTKDKVRIYGQDNTFEYRTGRKYQGFQHCKTCGMLVYMTIYGPPKEVLDAVPPERREAVDALVLKNLSLKPVNVRAFDVDLTSLKVKKSDEGTEGYELPE